MNTHIKEENTLLTLYTQFANLTLHFRERVCEECNYSVPTFYRKMRNRDKVVDGKQVRVFSNAEKAKMLEIGRALKEEFTAQMSLITEK